MDDAYHTPQQRYIPIVMAIIEINLTRSDSAFDARQWARGASYAGQSTQDIAPRQGAFGNPLGQH
jgi:hypothetical protein